MKKPVCEALISAETPKAASKVCTIQPTLVPTMAATPAARPDPMVRDSHKLMSGPGVMNSSSEAIVYVSRVVESGKKVMVAA